ncbi:MAG: hypothetical protein JST11_12080 [Acidobacteria bacterium]|nr:hypothetical protein [Acidobacteriota bacterium]
MSIVQGANGATQTVEAYNIGDGSFNLTVSSTASWLAASVGAQRTCTSRAGTCTPLSFALNTSGLPAGMATGIVTVSDPNTVDAPQTITVTVQMGGGVPASVDVYVAAGSSRDVTFSTNSPLSASTKTNDGGNWLSLTLDGVGSFRFTYPYRLRVAPPAGMGEGTYSGSVTTSGSSFPADNKSIALTMRVTSQPIAVASANAVNVQLAQGAPANTTAVALNNAGSGTLTVSGVTATGGAWLTATPYSGGALLKLDAGTLSPGTYTGSVAVASNAVNGTITVPVTFVVTPKGAPVIRYQGVVDNGTFAAGEAATGGDVMVVLGEQLSFGDLTVGQAPPLATTVGGAKVLVNGTEAPMYYSSYGQLAFQLPYGLSPGSVEVQVSRDGQLSNKVSVDIAPRAPRMLLIGSTGYGAIVNQDGSLPMPVGAISGVNTHPAHAGDTLTIYAIGLGETSPLPAAGTPAPAAEPLARLTAVPSVVFGGGIGAITATPLFAGLTPTYAGLYQVNVTIPDGVPKGTLGLTLVFPDSVSNAASIVIE